MWNRTNRNLKYKSMVTETRKSIDDIKSGAGQSWREKVMN